jgi:hypothetical protein
MKFQHLFIEMGVILHNIQLKADFVIFDMFHYYIWMATRQPKICPRVTSVRIMDHNRYLLACFYNNNCLGQTCATHQRIRNRQAF